MGVPDADWNRFRDRPSPLRAPEANREDLGFTRAALAMVENLDRNVGRVLRRLDELKLSDHTIVIYFSDNGPNSWRWNGGMKGRKGMIDEGGLRSVFCIRWPGRIQPGTNVRDICGAIDLLPTLAGMAHIPVVGGKPLDGIDISPLLLGTARDWPDRMIFSHQAGQVSVRTGQYRLGQGGALYDMVADPGQQTDLATQKPAIVAELSAAVSAWRKDVFGTGAAPVAEGKGPGQANRGDQPLDDRPYPVGYAEFPMTPLPARDGVPHGGIRRSSGAPNCSYFVNWTSADDRMTWDIAVNTTGDYDAVIHYTCPPEDAGSTIELSFNDHKATGKVAPGWDPPLIDNQDRVPRKGESYLKEFHMLHLGSMRLERGRGHLTLRALNIPGKSVMDVRLVTLTLKN
jgi:hypothetical protein